jgi:phosphoribosylanthranilate isomerase
MKDIKIKICGLTRECDIDYVNELLPDYVGFVFAKSRRRVEPLAAKKLIARLDPRIGRVGVFVNEDMGRVKGIGKLLKLNVLQLHGDEGIEYMKGFRDFEVWKAIGIENGDNAIEDRTAREKLMLDVIKKSPAAGILLDSQIGSERGGSGMPFDWGIVKALDINKKLILAGGLDQDNIIAACTQVDPEIVDVSSGVEKDGLKDYIYIKNFIERVRGL